jgi:hypothetical protein
MAEGHAQFAGFGGDRRINGRGELENQAGRVVGYDGRREVGGGIADEKTSGLLVQICGSTEKTGQEGVEGGERYQAAAVFHEESGGEIGIASLDASVRFVDGKFSENVVVVQMPVQAVRLGADGSEGFEEFEKSDVIVALALDDGKGIVGDGGVDGETLFKRG